MSAQRWMEASVTEVCLATCTSVPSLSLAPAQPQTIYHSYRGLQDKHLRVLEKGTFPLSINADPKDQGVYLMARFTKVRQAAADFLSML